MKNKHFFYTWLFAAVCLIMVACSTNSNQKNVVRQELYRINVDGKYGFIDQYGNIAIEPQFDLADVYFDSVGFAVLGDRKGLINRVGEFVAELDKDVRWVHFENGFGRCVKYDTKVNLIDYGGNAIFASDFEDMNWNGKYGVIVENSGGKWGCFNFKGEPVVPCVYDNLFRFAEGLAKVNSGGKWGFVDTLGVLVIDTILEDAFAFGKDGLARVKKDGKWMFIDKGGDMVTPMVYDSILTGMTNNRAFVKSGDVIRLIDRKGETIKEVDVEDVDNFREGYAPFKKNGKYGMLDTLGEIFIQAKYDELDCYDDGFSQFRLNEKYGIIDLSGAVIVEADYNNAANVISGYSLLYGQDYDFVKGNYCVTYYDRQGNVLWRDVLGNKYVLPYAPSKEDYVSYFDSKLSELDPIEGIYYATFDQMVVDRDNGHSSSNGSTTHFYAIIRDENDENEFIAHLIDPEDPGRSWVKKFVRLGETNTYAVVNRGESTWSEDGKLILEDPYDFEVSLRTSGNNYYNWYMECEFIKDYPTSSEYEQVQQAEWTGSGFAIADGFVATNYHVVKGAKTIRIKEVNGDQTETYKGHIVATDKKHDLAIIRVVDKDFKGFGEIPYCIGKSVPDVGDDVFALGFPLTSTMGEEVKLTDGIISSSSGYKGDESMYQISVPVQPGNSGGPLFDGDGNVIGVVCGKHVGAENANYAVKVSYLYSLVNESGHEIKMNSTNNVKSKTLSQKVKQVQPFVYLIECRSH